MSSRQGKRKLAGTLERSEVSAIFLAFLWLHVVPRFPWSHHPPCTQCWLFIYLFFMLWIRFAYVGTICSRSVISLPQILPPYKNTKSLVIPNRPKWSADGYQWSAIIPDMKLKFFTFREIGDGSSAVDSSNWLDPASPVTTKMVSSRILGFLDISVKSGTIGKQ